ncbi:Ig-like domain-containing protein, partial [Flavobacterium poyangense]
TTFTATNLTATTSYRAVVQSGSCATLNSTATTVTVSPTTVAGSVGGGTTVCTGTNSTLLTLSGHTGNIVRWESSLDNFATAGTPIVNTTTTFTATNLTATTSYRAVVKSGSCLQLNSVAATVTVSPTTVAGSVGGGATVCTGTNSTVLTLSGHTGSIIRWESSLDNFATAGTPFVNTATTFTATNLTATTSYRAVVQSGSCATLNSTATTVTVSPTTVAGSVGGGTTVCTGTNSTLLTLSGHT